MLLIANNFKRNEPERVLSPQDIFANIKDRITIAFLHPIAVMLKIS